MHFNVFSQAKGFFFLGGGDKAALHDQLATVLKK